MSSAWAALAAEELGYGVVFVALYSSPYRIADTLGLPMHVVPLVELAIGKLAENQYPAPTSLGEKVRSTYRGRGLERSI